MKNKLSKAKLILAVFCLSTVSLLIGVPTVSQEKLESLIRAENQEETEAKAVSNKEIN